MIGVRPIRIRGSSLGFDEISRDHLAEQLSGCSEAVCEDLIDAPTLRCAGRSSWWWRNCSVFRSREQATMSEIRVYPVSSMPQAAFVLLLLVLPSVSSTVVTQDSGLAAKPAAVTSGKAVTSEKLEQLVAPIALYPDALLTQVLMASTYPLEIVEAARWVAQQNEGNADALDKALQDEGWDPSVKSLCSLPSVLKRMSDNLDWTQDLGDAFLADQAALMDVVQSMRRKAVEAGNLKSTKEQVVRDQSDQIIVIESAKPSIVYVPSYYPTAVYGSWYYPTYYYPRIYVPAPPGVALFSFGLGVACGNAMWGGCNWGWGRTNININVNKHNTFINRTETSSRRSGLRSRAGSSGWQHDPKHRKGVRYSSPSAAKRFGGGASSRVSRDQARGFESSSRGSSSRTQKPISRQSSARKSSAGKTPARQATARKAPQRAATGGRNGSFTGSRNAAHTRAASLRGNSSRNTRSRSAAGRARSGGGRRRR